MNKNSTSKNVSRYDMFEYFDGATVLNIIVIFGIFIKKIRKQYEVTGIYAVLFSLPKFGLNDSKKEIKMRMRIWVI